MLTRRVTALFGLLLLPFLFGCTPPAAPPPTGTFPPQEKAAPVIATSSEKPKASARILAPEGQMPDWLKEQWSKKIGGDVGVDTYSTDAEALDKLRAQSPAYDLALVSDRVIAPLIKEQKLGPLPANQPALRADPMFTHHYFDFANRYCMPYAFSLSGIACRAAELKPLPTKWADVFSETNLKRTILPDDPALLAKLSGKENVKGAAPASAAKSAPDNLSKISETAVSTSTNSPPPVEVKPTGPPIEIGSMAMLKKKFSGEKAWRFILPEEGSAIYLYHAIVPASEPADGPAGTLLTEFFEPSTLARYDAENDFAATSKAVVKEAPEALTKDAQIYPPMSVLNKCYFIRK